MTVAWPTTPDTFPKPTSATYEDDASFLHDVVHSDIATVLERLESVASGELFVNGNYDWWQRIESGNQVCATAFNPISSFGPDRMFTLPAGASVTVSQNAGVPNIRSRWSCLISGAASVTTVDHGQRIRSVRRTLYKQVLIFSAYVHNATGASFTPLIRLDTPGGVDDWTTPTNRYSASLQACPNLTWTQVWAILDPSALTNIDNGLSVYIRIPSGSMVAGDLVYISQMSLRPGVALVPYLPPDPDAELLRCLVYYRKSYHLGTPLQTNTTTGLVGAGSPGSGASNVYPTVFFDPPMWKPPTIRFWGKAGTVNQFWNQATSTDANIVAALWSSSHGFSAANSATASEVVQFHYDAVAELT